MRIRNDYLNKSEIIFATNALERSKTAGLDGLPLDLFGAALAVSTRFRLSLFCEYWKSEIFRSKWKKGMIDSAFSATIENLYNSKLVFFCYVHSKVYMIIKIFIKLLEFHMTLARGT